MGSSKRPLINAFLGREIWFVPFYLACVVFVALLLARPLDNITHDLLLSSESPYTDPPDGTVIIKITEGTLGRFPYRSPVDRGFLAQLIENIENAKPRVIGIDILFDQPSEAEKDRKLERVLSNSSVPIVIASADTTDGLSEKQSGYLKEFAPLVKRGVPKLGIDPLDGVVRQLFNGQDEKGSFRPSFVSKIAEELGAKIPAGPKRDMVFYRTAGSSPFPFAGYPAETVNLLPSDWLAGKVVLIGVDLPLTDRYPTPFVLLNGVRAGTLPGVEIHAHGLAQLLAGDRIEHVGAVHALLLLAVALALGLWAALSSLPVLYKPPIILGIIAAIWAGAAFAFAKWGILIPTAIPTILVTGITGLAVFYAWKRDHSERNFIEQAFSQYLSPDVVRTIVKQPETLHLGGERRFITSIFTDMEGFTTLSENSDPEQIAEILNDYLDSICTLFTDYGVTIDKVVGDAVVGFLGAPVSHADQADRAVDLAIAVDRYSNRFRDEMKTKGIVVGATRIGIHAGHAVVGNFGGRRFFDYTAVGDTVNVAARLEQANKFLGTKICVSSAITQACTSSAFRPSGTIRLKGKNKDIDVFEPFDSNKHAKDLFEDYHEAFELMRLNNSTAFDAFSVLTQKYPCDGLTKFHLNRLGNGENGVFVLLNQ